MDHKDMKNPKVGDRVVMTDELKRLYWKGCSPGNHLGPYDSEDVLKEDCWGCSGRHVEEFGSCWGRIDAVEDSTCSLLGDEFVDVRWQPSNLRYGYDIKYLKRISKDKAAALDADRVDIDE